MNNPAIVVIAYNRPKALARLLDSLSNAEYPKERKVTLIISIDKSDNREVKKVADDYVWDYGEKRVNAREVNMGLKAHVLSCGDYAAEYGSIIVLEDDLYVATSFYEYSVRALDMSEGDERIAGVSLYNHLFNVHAREPFTAMDDGYDNWYLQFASSWGQAYTAKQWADFIKWYEPNKARTLVDVSVPDNVSGWSDKSWLKFFIKYVIETDKYFLYPRVSFTTNFSDVGEHAVKLDTDVQVPLAWNAAGREYRFATVDESRSVYDAFFENVLLKDEVASNTGVDRTQVIIDLYGLKNIEGMKAKDNGLKILVSSRPYPYKVLKSYARALRPVDANVTCRIQGCDLFVYDLNEKGVLPIINEAERYLYDYRGISAKRMTAILKYRIAEKFCK